MLTAGVDLAGRGRLDLGRREPLVRASHDAFDAVIAAPVGRASALGRATRPGAGQVGLARIEGWIAVPTLELDAPADQPIVF
ncbi:hypothetical protein [Dactylosporangium sp. CA-139066]|uniref:hypothetical protein n=1 Tax=Dactylosporangium sp. CA-139066 TaxID=3239930 RepID=UPI003D92332D